MKLLAHIFLIFFAALLCKCSLINNNSNNDILGYWQPTSFNSICGNYCDKLYFSADSLTYLWDIGVSHTYPYQIRNNTVSVIIGKEKMYLGKYSVIEERLHFNTGFILSKIEPPMISTTELIGIETNYGIKSINMCGSKLLLYKNSNEMLMLAKGDAVFSLDSAIYKNEPITYIKENNPDNIYVFVGKGITLQDLTKLYTTLIYQNPNAVNPHLMEVILCLKTDEHGKYRIFKDLIFKFWKEDLDKIYSPYPRKLRQSPFPSKKSFLEYVDSTKNINHAKDLDKLSRMKPGIIYLISLSSTLSINDYIYAQEMCRKQNTTFYRTEINLEEFHLDN